MMYSKTSDGLRSIQESPIWDLLEEERNFSVLKSFDELSSPYLKQCFAYCSMFKKGFEIEKDDLIELWMARGLLQPSPGLELVDIGNKYFSILLENSLFEDVTEGNNGVTKYKMHNLMHGLAEYVSKSKSKDSNEIRHMAHISTSAVLQGIRRQSIHKMQTVFLNGQVVGNILSCLEGLRVLNLYAADLEELPISFGKLKHLRYLNVSRTKIKGLPKSIGKLYNLQTLKMQGLYLEEFPKKFRHFYFDKDRMKFPVGIGRLTNLRSLSFFIVGKERGRGVEELGGLENLKGKLSIYNLELVRDYEEAKKARLAEKTKIQKLRFVWEADKSSANNDEDVLDGLQPRSDLESLEICNFLGDERSPSGAVLEELPAAHFHASGCI